MMLALRVSGIVAVLALAGCSTPSTPSATTHSTTGPLTSVPSPTLAPSPTLEPSASSPAARAMPECARCRLSLGRRWPRWSRHL